MKWRTEVEATPEEVAELIKRVGSNWAEAATELTVKHAFDSAGSDWSKYANDFYKRLYGLRGD